MAIRIGPFVPLWLALWLSFAAAAPSSVVAQKSTLQTIRGEVVDRTAQIPLPGANVILLDSEPLLGASTDVEGWFVLNSVPLGRHDIKVSFLGYETVVLPQVLVTSGKEILLRIELREQLLESAEVVVTAGVRKDEALNDLAFVSARTFSVEETRRYAGGLDDPARMASAFAGITTGGNIQENALIIRGNAPKGVLWRLEGVEIPNPSHFAGLSVAGGGGLTLFSSQLLANSDFFTGAFPAEYGNALAGVFDMNFRSGNRGSREHTIQAGVIGLEIASEGPFKLGSPSTYLFNYRYSTLGLILPLLPTEDVATYQDLSFKLSFPTRTMGRFDVWGIGGIDGQSGSATDDSTKWEYETWDRVDSDLSLAVGAAGVSHDLILGQRSHLHTSFAATINRTRLNNRRLGDDLLLRDHLSIRNKDTRVVLGMYLSQSLGPRHTNRTGISLQQLIFDVNLQAATRNDEPLVPVARASGSSTLLQLYSQSKFRLATQLSVDAGVHVQHFALTTHTSIEPRTGLRWEFVTGQTLSLGYGLHSQIEDLRIYFISGADKTVEPRLNWDLAPARAHHLVLGYDRTLGADKRLRVEAYYQSLFDVPVIADSSYSLINFEQDFEFNEALVNAGAGRNYGVEVTLERFLQRGYYYLATGSVFRSRYRGGDGVWRDSRFDRGYAFNTLFGKEWSVGDDDILGLNGRLNLMGGKRRSPLDLPASVSAEDVLYDERQAFRDRDPDFFILDITVTYRRNHSKYSEVWALQVKNVLGAKNVFPDYNYAKKTVVDVEEGFPLPVLSYKVEF